MRPLLTSALALLVLAAPAIAQGTLAPRAIAAPTVEDPVVSAELVAALESASAADRGGALHRILTLAYSEGVDLRPALPALLAVFRSDADAGHRTLALRAIEASADADAMSTVRAEAWKESDPAVRRLAFSVLMDHYGVETLRNDPGVSDLARSIRADLDS